MGQISQVTFGRSTDNAILAERLDRWLGAAYFLAAVSALMFSRVENGIALLWLATALLVPRLTRIRVRHWPRPILYCTVACLLAGDVPTRLADYPLDTARVLTGAGHPDG